MQILIVSSALAVRGGVISYINAIADRFRKLNYNLKIINVMDRGTSKFTLFNYSTVKTVNMLLRNDLVFIAAFTVSRWILQFKTAKEIRKDRECVIHVQDINSFNAAYEFCRREKIKLVLTVHGFLHDGTTAAGRVKPNSFLSRYLFKHEVRAFKNAEHIIIISSYQYEILRGLTDERKFILTHNFVDTSKFYPYDEEHRKKLKIKYEFKDDFILVYAGRLAKSKGIIYILKAMIKLRKKFNIKLIVFGSGPEKDALIEFAKQNRLEDTAIFNGEVSQDELVDLYNASDAFIMAPVVRHGHIEGSSMAFLEAMACRLPVISTDIGGNGDIMKDMGSELIVNEEDDQSIVEKLSMLYSDIDFRNKEANRSLSAIKQNYSLDIMIKKLCNVYFGEGKSI